AQGPDHAGRLSDRAAAVASRSRRDRPGAGVGRKDRAERQRAGRQKRLCLRRSSGSMTDPTSLTLAQARDALRARELSALELTEAHLSAIESARVLNAFVLETPDRAREMARASDARLAKGEGGPLEGMPLGIKDLFCTEGVRTTACSHILDNFVPTYESTVTSNLWRDGAVLLGKLNNDEFAMGSSNETSCFGPVAAPWRRRGSDAKLVPGGSSGGSGGAGPAETVGGRRRGARGSGGSVPPGPTPAARSASQRRSAVSSD